MARQRIMEPFVWLLFGAGGMAAALFLPILILLFGVAFPLGWAEPPDHASLLGLLQNPLVRLALFLICFVSLVHAAHRFRFTIYDGFQVKHLKPLIDPLSYGAAVLGTIIAGYLLFTL